MTTATDRHRSEVYGAEDQVRSLLDRGGQVDFHGSTFDLPAERRFGDIGSIDRYLTALRGQPWGFPLTPPPVVRAARTDARATWRAPGIIEVPDRTRWALRELVILHEYCHHVTYHSGRGALHDRAFCEVHVELVRHALAPAVATLLLAAYSEAGAYVPPN
jgi:putative metallohydrolase (TIGR04338 family)